MDVKSILENKISFKKLADGAHPSTFWAMNDMSLNDHFELLEASFEYKQEFQKAMIAALAAWHEVADAAMLKKTPSSQSQKSYLKGPHHIEKFESKLFEQRIRDLERFVPEFSKLEQYTMQGLSLDGIKVVFEDPTKREESIKAEKEYVENEGKLS